MAGEEGPELYEMFLFSSALESDQGVRTRGGNRKKAPHYDFIRILGNTAVKQVLRTHIFTTPPAQTLKNQPMVAADVKRS